MSVSKLKDGSGWKVYIRFVDWQGKKQVHTKQTFETKRDALNYERDFIQKKSRDIQMNFAKFVEIYLEDIKPRIKLNTFMTKKHIIETKILPYFGNKSLAEIDSTDVIQWQNVLLCARDENGKAYAATYLRTVQNQLSAIFNHAHRFYGLPDNPSSKAGKIGKAKAKEMLFWTKEEYEKFSDAIKDKPISYYAFQVLYWTGIREGELLSLVKSDFDLVKRKLTISKSYQRINGEDIITSPKTEKSNRVIDLPKFLCDEMEDYFGMFYSLAEDTRLFHISKSYLHHEMDRGCKKAGVKRVRVHDIRHSHVAHLISLGFTPVEIAERLGHEGISVTYTYSHLYPSKQKELADRLDADHGNGDMLDGLTEGKEGDADENAK